MLGILEYFWDPNAPVHPPPAIPPIPDPGHGSGKGRGREYALLGEDYWDAREAAMLEAIPPPVIPAPSIPNSYYENLQNQLIGLQFAQQSLTQSLKASATPTDLMDKAGQLAEVKSTIAEVSRKLNRKPT